MPDVPRSLQSWVSTIQTVVLTADVFQLFIETVPVWLHQWALPFCEQIDSIYGTAVLKFAGPGSKSLSCVLYALTSITCLHNFSSGCFLFFSALIRPSSELLFLLFLRTASRLHWYTRYSSRWPDIATYSVKRKNSASHGNTAIPQ